MNLNQENNIRLKGKNIYNYELEVASEKMIVIDFPFKIADHQFLGEQDTIGGDMKDKGLYLKIRESSFGQRFIVLTSIDDLNEMREIINLGIDGILQKPFERSKFLEVAYRVSSNVYKRITKL